MHFVYLIRSEQNGMLYFGKTDSLERRLQQHNDKRNASTSKYTPWEYVYIEGYRSAKDATKRELQLKQYGNARTYVKRRITQSLIE